MQPLLLHYCFSSVQCAVQGADVSQQADAVHGAGLQLLLAGWLLTRIRAVFREGVLSQLSNEAYGQYCEPTTKLGLLPQCHYFAILSAFGCTIPLSLIIYVYLSKYQSWPLNSCCWQRPSDHIVNTGMFLRNIMHLFTVHQFVKIYYHSNSCLQTSRKQISRSTCYEF